eukprot:8378619-Lingulodinium_polyedra.AAC.1
MVPHLRDLLQDRAASSLHGGAVVPVPDLSAALLLASAQRPCLPRMTKTLTQASHLEDLRAYLIQRKPPAAVIALGEDRHFEESFAGIAGYQVSCYQGTSADVGLPFSPPEPVHLLFLVRDDKGVGGRGAKHVVQCMQRMAVKTPFHADSFVRRCGEVEAGHAGIAEHEAIDACKDQIMQRAKRKMHSSAASDEGGCDALPQETGAAADAATAFDGKTLPQACAEAKKDCPVSSVSNR